MAKPLVIDLCAGLGGWSAGFLAEGWDAIGFDIERHEYGDKRYPGELILKDITTLCGYDLRAVSPALVVASPPCQNYSYMAMPWTRAKAMAAAIRADESGAAVADLNRLYNACFRIARELDVPIVLENVKGAQPWVGRAQAHFGSYFLWGNVESVGGAIVRSRGVPKFGETLRVHRIKKRDGRNFHAFENGLGSSPAFNGGEHETRGVAVKVPGVQFSGYGEPGYKAQGFNVTAAQRYRIERDGVKQHGSGAAWFDKALNERRKEATATKGGGDWFSSGEGMSLQRHANSKSDSRKAASAMIAEIPFELASYVARVFKPA